MTSDCTPSKAHCAIVSAMRMRKPRHEAQRLRGEQRHAARVFEKVVRRAPDAEREFSPRIFRAVERAQHGLRRLDALDRHAAFGGEVESDLIDVFEPAVDVAQMCACFAIEAFEVSATALRIGVRVRRRRPRPSRSLFRSRAARASSRGR